MIGLSSEANHPWLADHGIVPVAYGEGVDDRIRAASTGRVDAFVDAFGDGYVELALDLGVPADGINTVIDFAAAEKYGVRSDGNATLGATAPPGPETWGRMFGGCWRQMREARPRPAAL